MINRRNYKNICVLLALTSISCSDSEGWMSSIPLSNEKISFTASLQEGWSGGQGSGDKSRAVKPDFPGLAREQKVLTTDEALSKPLYLHPIETVNKTQKNQGPTTRGTMNMSTVVDNFGVSANYIQNGSSAESEEKSLFHNEKATKEGSNWFVAGNKTWPLDGSVSFYAYAPYNDPSLSLQGSNDVVKNKTIHYTANTVDISNQPDLIVAKSESNAFTSKAANKAVNLKFSHALTAITFSVSDDMEKGVINSIKIEGVKGEGDYDLSTKEWSVSSSSAASYNVPISAGGLTVGTGTVDLAANATLMMIPQTLGDDAKVTINITPNGKSAVDLTFKLNGTHWDPGNHVTYLLSTTKIIKLNMGSVTYPKWQTAEGSAFTSEKLKSDYASDDSLGMYIVDKNHKVVKANVLLTTTDGKKWNFSSLQKFTGSLSYDYFLYYPYQAGGLAGAPNEGEAVSVNSVTNQISASDFFADAITEWGKSLKTDQGGDVNFNSCDLQIGKGELAESSSTVAFPTMTHAMGLAHVKLGKRSLSSGVTYISKNDFGPSIDPYTWGGNIAYASSEVAGRQLFPLAKYDYACIVSPGISTEFNTASGVKNAWEKPLTFTPSTNKVQMQEALVADTGSGKTEDYDIQLGDIFFNDGSITHDLKDVEKSEDHFPVGIVVYLAKNNNGNDKWAETNTKIGEYTVGGHGLVMCLKTIGSTGPTNFGNNYAWYSGGYTDTEIDNVQNKSDILKSKNQSNGSGYTNTNYLIDLWSSAAAATAAYQAKNYKELPVNSSKCTGWFLPSAGQYYAALSQCGGMSSDWEFNSYFSVTTKINDMLKKVGDYNYNYTVFFRQGGYTWTWTSSEYSSYAAVAIGSGVDASSGSGSVRFFSRSKTATLPVRPFLAF